jgi:hypothetical protein
MSVINFNLPTFNHSQIKLYIYSYKFLHVVVKLQAVNSTVSLFPSFVPMCWMSSSSLEELVIQSQECY